MFCFPFFDLLGDGDDADDDVPHGNEGVIVANGKKRLCNLVWSVLSTRFLYYELRNATGLSCERVHCSCSFFDNRFLRIMVTILLYHFTNELSSSNPTVGTANHKTHTNGTSQKVAEMSTRQYKK